MIRKLIIVTLLMAGCAAPVQPTRTPPPAEPTATAAVELPTDVPIATSEPTEAPAPAATEAPTPAFTPITLKGRGDKIVKFTIPANAAALAKMSYSGSDNFVVWTIGDDGKEQDLLANTIGIYTGTRLFDLENHSVAFEVETVGSWSIIVKPITSVRIWDTSTVLSGKGDDVVALLPQSSGFATATITHKGSDNFVVYGYTPDGADLLVNEIGRYSGQVLLTDGTLLLEVEADGTWTVTLDK